MKCTVLVFASPLKTIVLPTEIAKHRLYIIQTTFIKPSVKFVISW